MPDLSESAIKELNEAIQRQVGSIMSTPTMQQLASVLQSKAAEAGLSKDTLSELTAKLQSMGDLASKGNGGAMDLSTLLGAFGLLNTDAFKDAGAAQKDTGAAGRAGETSASAAHDQVS
ncbi:hypothetical protein OG203_02290 [Nocardia sp. NBC_01499]|uniref:hypothetical protein n=1 Tax=Nocardia sp. NBC_01499 TaxID=2903597 RepID=UPI00386B6F7C